MIDNLTPFAATTFVSMTGVGQEVEVALVTARFNLPPGGRPGGVTLPLNEEQRSPPLEDVYWRDAGSSSLRYEGQACYVRPGTDIYLNGHAIAPAGRAAVQSQLGLRVGPCERIAIVHGDREWRRGVMGLVPSSPRAFVRIPIRYEHCFGGAASAQSPRAGQASDRNPVGVGLPDAEGSWVDRPLPNFEAPRAQIGSVKDMPLPQGFGPIARNWMPRRTFGGTYDQRWTKNRAPIWAEDFDERFFCAASADLCAVPYLRGGEPVKLIGVSADGPIAFSLPDVALQARFRPPGGDQRRPMPLDAVLLEPDEGVLTMSWRAHLLSRGDVLQNGPVTVRRLKDWERAR